MKHIIIVLAMLSSPAQADWIDDMAKQMMEAFPPGKGCTAPMSREQFDGFYSISGSDAEWREYLRRFAKECGAEGERL